MEGTEMVWLKAAAAALVKGATIVQTFLPLLAGVIPARAADKVKEVSDDFTRIAGIVTMVEAAAAAMTSPASGAEKLKMATPLVVQVILQSDMLQDEKGGTRKIKDPVKFQQGAASIASGVADVLSSLED
jgi:hypothetical protein